MTRSDVEAILMKEKEKASISSICLNIKPPYAIKVTSKAIANGLCHFTVSKFDGTRVKKKGAYCSLP